MTAHTSTLRALLLGAIVLTVAVSPMAAATQLASPANQADGTLTVTVTDQTDTTVTVTLETTVQDAAGYQANLTFDPAVVQVASVDGADFDDPVVNVDNDEGWVRFTESQVDGLDAPAFATITFDLVGDGTSPVSFVEEFSTVNDADGIDLDVATDSTDIEGDDDGGSGGPPDIGGGPPGDDGDGSDGDDDGDGDDGDDDGNGDDGSEDGGDGGENSGVADTGDDGGEDSEESGDGETSDDDTEPAPLPGFGSGVTLVALLVTAGLALRRID